MRDPGGGWRTGELYMTHIDPVGIKLIEHFSILIFMDWKNIVIFLQKNMITNYLRAVPFCLSHRNWKEKKKRIKNAIWPPRHLLEFTTTGVCPSVPSVWMLSTHVAGSLDYNLQQQSEILIFIWSQPRKL